ncbi:nuclear RNA export factor 1-like [Oscarella lobularis]|uniref:nuclear RNA export factor 1-like n=1 Tax=Oscarella lobularis TaxID=121494 RepID=UPI003313C1FF
MAHQADARFVIKASRDGSRQVESYGRPGRGQSSDRSRSGRMRRGRSRGPSHSYYRGRGRGLNPRTRLEDDGDADFDGDFEMGGESDSSGSATRRYTPYGRPASTPYSRPTSASTSFRRPGRPSPHDRSDPLPGRRGLWNKIIIPGGAQHNQDWLLRQLRSSIREVFEPIEFHVSGQAACFYVRDERAARELKSLRIQTRDGSELSVIVKVGQSPRDHGSSSSSAAAAAAAFGPQRLAQQLMGGGAFQSADRSGSLQIEEAIKLALGERYDTTTNALDLSDFYNDDVLRRNGERVILGRANYMEAVLKVIGENCPQLQGLNLGSNRLMTLDGLKELETRVPNLEILNLSNNQIRSEAELDKLKGLARLKSIALEGNPFTMQYKTPGSYISSIQNRLGVIELDGQLLPARIGFDLPAPSSLPQAKEGYCGDDGVRAIVHQFLETYYGCYDTPRGRERLIEAYTDDALFSLSVCSSTSAGKQRGPPLGDYVRQSRNLMRIRDSGKRTELLKRGRLCIASFLNELPKTKHVPSTFVIDVSLSTPTCVVFSVGGSFQEVGGVRTTLRSFTRLFVCVRSPGNSLLIANDQLQIRNASLQRLRAIEGSSDQMATPSFGGADAGLSQQHRDAILQFSKESGMNFEWSQKCLSENGWVYLQAAQAFTTLQKNSAIPPEAFQ